MKIIQPDRKTLTAFFLVVFLGGINSVAIRFSNRELPPFYGASLRLSLAALAFWILFFVQRRSLPPMRDVLILLANGFIATGVSFGLMYWGLQTVPAGLASVILALGPLFTFSFALLHGLESFRWQVAIGSLISIVGMALAVNAQVSMEIPFISLLALLAGAVISAEGNVILKILSPSSDPVTLNALMLSSGGIFLALASVFVYETWIIPSQPSTWFALTYLVLGGSFLMFYFFVYVLTNWSVSAASYTILLFPIVATLFGAFLAGEGTSPLFVFGGVIVIFGVWFGAFFHPKA